MKSIAFSCLLVLMSIWGCNSGSAPNTENPEETEPLEWVHFRGQEGPGAGRRIVLVSGDEEYRSEEALPQLARILAERHGFDCTVLFAQDPEKPGIINPNYVQNIPGLEELDQADLLVLFTRFRALPDSQMAHIEKFLLAGKPLIGIRTATHAFQFKDTAGHYYPWSNSFNDETSSWDGGFGRLVLGERWYTHHGHHKNQSTVGLIAPGSEDHPIIRGIRSGDIWGPTDVYGVRLPLPGDALPLMLGQVTDRTGEFNENDPFFGMRPTDRVAATTNPGNKDPYNPNDPMMPIAWIKSYQLPEGRPGKAFTSTIGSSTDMTNEGVRRLLVNAVYYLSSMDTPEKADVDLVGVYEPSAYSFHDDAYWEEKNLLVEEVRKGGK